MFENQKELAAKAFYVTIGAPVVLTRNAKELSTKLAGYGDKITAEAHTVIDEYAKEGEKVTKQLRGNNVVEEIQNRVDLEKVQDRVEKIRDQLESALQSWRESFSPEGAKEAATKVTVEAEAVEAKPAAAKAPAKKAPAKSTATKAAPAKTTARKTTTTKKAPATTPSA